MGRQHPVRQPSLMIVMHLLLLLSVQGIQARRLAQELALPPVAAATALLVEPTADLSAAAAPVAAAAEAVSAVAVPIPALATAAPVVVVEAAPAPPQTGVDVPAELAAASAAVDAVALEPVAAVEPVEVVEPEQPAEETAVTIAAAPAPAPATPVLDLTATNTVAGKTPAVIGVNLGHRHPSSNWQLWMQRLGVNGARVFLSSLWGTSLYFFVGGNSKWGLSLSGAPVNSSAAFQTAVAQLRTPAGHDPAQTASWSHPVRFDKFDAKFPTTDNSTLADEQEGNHNATLAALKRIPGLTNAPLVVISCGLGSVRNGTVLDNTTSVYWQKSWEVYKHFYAFSRYLWLRGVTRIELYNEPDLETEFALGTGFNNPLWVDTIAVRSRAIQDLYADMNAEDTSAAADLVPDIHVGAYAKTTYGGGNMGQPGVHARHNPFATGVSYNASWSSFSTYSYHSYGQSGKTILSNFNELQTASAADMTAQGQFPFSLTEFNAKTSGDFASITSNMDTDSQAVKLGSQAINLATAGSQLTSLYAFKFSVTLSSGNNGVTKNGLHWGDNTGVPFNIADSTLGAEALRLVAEKLSGAKDVLNLTSTAAATLVDTKTIAVKDGSAYYVYIVNTGSSAITATLTLTNWGIPSGRAVIVERVNATMWGEVDTILSTSSSRTVSVRLGIDNLVRLTIPAAATVTQTSVVASQGGHVRAGSLSATNYGTATTMCVGTTTTSTHSNTYASAVRFNVSNPATITSAVLKLTLSSLSASLTAPMNMLLLAIPDNTWTSTNLTWTALVKSGTGALLAHPPAGAATTWVLDSVAKNFINWNATGIQIVGHVTLPVLTTSKASGVVKQVDVTQYVKASGGTVSFMLVRPFRRNQEKASGDTMAADTLNAGTYACFHSPRASTTANKPSLLIY